VREFYRRRNALQPGSHPDIALKDGKGCGSSDRNGQRSRIGSQGAPHNSNGPKAIGGMDVAHIRQSSMLRCAAMKVGHFVGTGRWWRCSKQSDQ
jgi:hypothetical protein